MAADARTGLAPARAHVLSAVRVTPAQALGLVFAASVIARTLAAWLRSTPVYFADEYIYSEVGRSLAEHGRPLVRGTGAHFPALLQPVLTAPAWLTDDVGLSFRLIQLEGAVFMSATALVVYWLARRIELTPWMSVAAAAFAVAGPHLLYVGWMLADPLAFPLALGAVAAGVTALSRPSRKSQLLFLALAALATLARVQFVILPICFLVSLIVVGVRERRLRRALGEQRLPLALLGLSLVALFAAGPSRTLGYYDVILENHFDPWPIVKWFGSDAMLLLYSSGWVLVPGALVGLVLAIWRPRSRGELAFGAFATTVSAALLFEAAFYGANGADRIQERYFFYILPLIGLLFALWARRGFPFQRHHLAVAAVLLLVSVRVPLSGFSAARGKMNSPFLFAVGQLEILAGSAATASLAIALSVLALTVLSVLAIRRLRHAGLALVAVAIALSCSASAASVKFDREISRGVYELFLWPDPSFVDHAALGNVALLESPLANSGFTSEELFWNRSIDRVLLLPDASPPDMFSTKDVRIARDGALLVDGKPLSTPLLVSTFGSTIDLSGTTPVGGNRFYQLVRPAPAARLSLFAPGRYYDGWLNLVGELRLWPKPGESLAGRVRFELSLPAGVEGSTVRFRLPSGTKSVRVEPGRSVAVSLPVCSSGPWSSEFHGSLSARVSGRFVSARSTRPSYVPDAAACRSAPAKSDESA